MTSAPKGLDTLYPFLSEDGTEAPPGTGHKTPDEALALVAEVRRSAEEKAAEVARLREEVLTGEHERLVACAGAMAARLVGGGKLLAFGNGGSSTDAQSLAGLFLHPHRGRSLPALCLTNDVAVVTALANDVAFDVVFARQVAAFGSPNDIAFGISTSGSSRNLLAAFEEASRRGLLTVGVAGYKGGEMAERGGIEHLFVVPSSSVHRIQEAQTSLMHVLWELTQEVLAS